jgi:hypothetical protein
MNTTDVCVASETTLRLSLPTTVILFVIGGTKKAL